MRITSACLLLALGLPFSSAYAQDSAAWAKVGNWDVRVDPTLNNSCFMVGGYRSGTILRVGFDNRHNASYFVIGNAAWRSLEVGKRYQLGAQFDGGQIAYWDAQAVSMGDTIALSVVFNSPSPNEVLAVFGQRLSLRLFYQGTAVANLRLSGTAAAAAETINCNNQFMATRPDPFSGASRPVVADPFGS